jgi:hypothetical protein
MNKKTRNLKHGAYKTSYFRRAEVPGSTQIPVGKRRRAGGELTGSLSGLRTLLGFILYGNFYP